MLVSVDKFNFYQRVTSTSKIEISITKTDEIGAFKLFKGEVSLNRQTVAAGNIKVFNPENEDN